VLGNEAPKLVMLSIAGMVAKKEKQEDFQV
jgi:hypothetical protein